MFLQAEYIGVIMSTKIIRKGMGAGTFLGRGFSGCGCGCGGFLVGNTGGRKVGIDFGEGCGEAGDVPAYEQHDAFELLRVNDALGLN